jgi:hypothetical protein
MSHGAYWQPMKIGPWDVSHSGGNEHVEDGVCTSTITYMLDGKVGLLADLMLMAQVAAMAREVCLLHLRQSIFLVMNVSAREIRPFLWRICTGIAESELLVQEVLSCNDRDICRWTNHFEDVRKLQPGPEPGCKPPPPNELVACPRTARHCVGATSYLKGQSKCS